MASSTQQILATTSSDVKFHLRPLAGWTKGGNPYGHGTPRLSICLKGRLRDMHAEMIHPVPVHENRKMNMACWVLPAQLAVLLPPALQFWFRGVLPH